jgi:hypothetical protein
MNNPPTAADAGVPSRRGYLVAAAIVIVTLASFLILLTWRLSDIGGGMVRFTAPGVHEATLSPGSYTIFQETSASSDGTVQSGGGLSGLRVTVQRPGGGVAVPLGVNTGSRYNVGSRSGVSLFDFTILEAGLYRIEAAYPDGRAAPQGTLAVGQGFLGALLTTIAGGLAIMLVGLGLAIGVAVWTFVRRRKARRAAGA